MFLSLVLVVKDFLYLSTLQLLNTEHSFTIMESTTQYDQTDSKVFDYIIIGGGTAGLVLAARLSEDPAMQVVVLEAGEERLDVSFIGSFHYHGD